ncbi:hypothetical protein DAEQUDRAFT_465088 [Daedalea quercina L-15889]|uniref:Transmembrane protein n=1 Tax=Daedalea quercina L-15889 TaxID=1314783 RepID=A0A165TEZ3_9APHY|nr:hypothetical protein DAEQUDRAFT_465088 [Daedalea quercina L-15889]
MTVHRDVERVSNRDSLSRQAGLAVLPPTASRSGHRVCPLFSAFYARRTCAASVMRPTILVVLACCTHVLGTHALAVRNHGRLARPRTLEDKRDFPGLLGLDGEANAPPDGEAEGTTDPRPSGTATHEDGVSFSSFGLFPGLLPTGSETSKTKDALTSTSSASTSATPQVRLATTTQAEPAASLTGSAVTATSQATENKQDRLPGSNASSSSGSWKIIGVAVICFTAVVAVLVAAVFFDTWWQFLRDLFWKRRKHDDFEEMVPDWQKASWEMRFGDRQRYPSFGSLPTSPVLRGDPLQRQRSLRVQEWQKDELASSTSSPSSVEKLAQHPAVPPNAYVSPDPRPSPGSVDPFKDRSPSLISGLTYNTQDTRKSPFHDTEGSQMEMLNEK